MRNQNSSKVRRWTILDVLQWTTDYFKTHHIDSPRLTSEILLAEVLGVSRIDLYLRFEQPLTESERQRFKVMVRRRVQREPVAYILGKKEFWGIELDVSPDVLVPRPDTEILVEAALELLPETGSETTRVIDLGTGSGAIVIALAVTRNIPHYFATDISFPALHLAARNAEKSGVADRIRFFGGSWLAPVRKTPSFNLILSNPPYIPSGDISHLDPEVRAYEPHLALDGDRDGLRDLARLIFDAPAYLVTGGVLMLEIGYDQKDAVRRLAETAGDYDDIAFRKDYGGHDRVAVLRKSLKIAGQSDRNLA